MSNAPVEPAARVIPACEWWLVAVAHGDAGAALEVGGRPCQPLKGTNLVHAPDGAILLASGACRAVRVDMAPAVKLLAFHDHVTHGEPANRAPSGPVVVAVPAQFGRETSLVAWLTGRLATARRDMTPLCDVLAQSESYRLVRFLLAQGSSATVADLSVRYGLSGTHFRRLCRLALGRALKTELRELRAVQSLLACASGALTFTHVAADFGYASPAHFSTDIRNLFGKSPTELFRPALPGGYRS